ncbi:MAG TPA: tRNA lysidine(34) synthetase TilS [Polyangia bacterium]|jgi:tRNA(Ile)-lysidine synthase|nr:tRNA lysidine(34) synthetase TilS [Polyangia bacterium]
MLSSVLRTIRRHHLCAAGERVLVAVSGGPDSMALLHALWELSPRLSLTLEVATVDHGMRPEARIEAGRVAERAAALDLPWHLLTVDVAAARRAARGSSWQEAARAVRLQALQELAVRQGAHHVALGHQADDQAETVLFRVLRGTGVRGLGGIPYQRKPFIRPLLDVRRRAVLAYLKRRSISFVEDSSNADLRFARARLRQRVLPVLEAENPRVVEALLALAADAARVTAAGHDADAADVADMANVANVDRRSVSRGAAAVIEQLQQRGGSASVNVRGGRVEVAYGKSRFVPARGDASAAAAGDAAEGPREITIVAPGAYSWATETARDPRSFVVEISEQRQPPRPASEPSGAAFDADVLRQPLRLRARRPGDRMVPRGGAGSRKLSDLFIDAKISRDQRAAVPVLTTADDIILFVPGLRPSEFGRPTRATSRWVRVTALQGPGGG